MKIIPLINEFTESMKLENKLKLLVYNANKIDLTIKDYYNLKYGNNSYEDINIKIKKLTNIKYDQKLTSNHSIF